jgi:hypothetical protein
VVALVPMTWLIVVVCVAVLVVLWMGVVASNSDVRSVAVVELQLEPINVCTW